VLASIDLDDDARIEADKIKDESLKRKLPPEFQAWQTPAAQEAPHGCFGMGRCAPQPLGVRAHCIHDHLAASLRIH
jgi:hypothetical protein